MLIFFFPFGCGFFDSLQEPGQIPLGNREQENRQVHVVQERTRSLLQQSILSSGFRSRETTWGGTTRAFLPFKLLPSLGRGLLTMESSNLARLSVWFGRGCSDPSISSACRRTAPFRSRHAFTFSECAAEKPAKPARCGGLISVSSYTPPP